MRKAAILLPLYFSVLVSSCSKGEEAKKATEAESPSASTNAAASSPTTASTRSAPATPIKVFDKSDITGSWDCDTDAAPRIVQSLPPQDARIAQGTDFMAPKPARFEYALAKGGPTGMFAQGHLHLIHNDRSGRTNFTGIVLVTDQSGYYFAALPVLETHVDGSSKKSSRHLHCGAQFTFSKAIAETINSASANGSKISLKFVGGRDRGSFVDGLKRTFKKELVNFKEDPSNTTALIAALNGA